MDKTGKKIDKYVFQNKIGEGSYAEVYQAKNIEDGKLYAIKCLKRKVALAHQEIDKQPQLKKFLKTEVYIMSEIFHPNIMHLFDFLESSNNYYLALQYCNKGDLEKHIGNQPKRLLDEARAIFFLKQIMNGFQVLNKKEVMHRDFKLANIFLHEETVVIGDFGFARAGHEMAQTNLGTPLTKAPELHLGEVGTAESAV